MTRPLVSSPATLTALLDERADARGDDLAFGFVNRHCDIVDRRTLARLRRNALGFAHQLGARGVRPGDRVVLLFTPGLSFVDAFVGCLYAGAIAVPAAAGVGRSISERMSSIIDDCEPRVIVASSGAARDIEELARRRSRLPPAWIGEGYEDEPAAPGQDMGPDSVAVLQYTSGSTSMPKGVRVLQRNLLVNTRDMAAQFRCTPQDLMVSWLPSYHDMGLVFGILLPLVAGYPALLASPLSFLRDPGFWLETISRHGATISGSPNFGFEMCLRKVDAPRISRLDLGRWRVVLNGAETVRAQTLRAFTEKLAPAGFRMGTFYPGYGLAESTLVVCGGPLGHPRVLTVEKQALAQGRVVVTTRSDPSIAAEIVSCGPALPCAELAIVNPDTCRRCPPDGVGEVWVRGPTVADGYWNEDSAPGSAFTGFIEGEPGGPWLRTGDLGFMHDGHVYPAGRIKDLVIVAGRNIYPQDIERIVETAVSAVRIGCVAAFAFEHDEGEALAVALELASAMDADQVFGIVRKAIWDEEGISVAQVHILKAGSVLKTSSGKVRRRATGDGIGAGAISPIASWPVRARPVDEGDAARAGATTGGPSLDSFVTWLRRRLAEVLETSADAIPGDRPFYDLGLTSQQAVAVAAEIEDRVEQPLPPTLLWQHPTVDALARALFSAVPAQVAAKTSGVPRRDDPPLAITGIACRFASVVGPEELWELLLAGRSTIAEAAPERWPDVATAELPPGARRGAYLDRVYDFDPGFFGIVPDEARAMDPQHRLLLELVYEALQRAGVAPESLAGQNVGVFASVGLDDYARRRVRASVAAAEHTPVGEPPSLAAGRVAYRFGLRGPALVVDTACSSSLVALHLACQSLRSGECSLAVVGAVNLILDPESSVGLARRGALSQSGHLRAFDVAADGYVRGEGGGALVLRPLGDALAARDTIIAAVRATAVNNDGRSNGLTAPSGEAQVEVIRQTLQLGGVDASQVRFVEAHGTGTPLGDPIELQALARAYATRERRDEELYVGSIKAAIGHLESAAGIAGVIKAALIARHRTIPPQAAFQTPSDKFDWAGHRLRVPTRTLPIDPRDGDAHPPIRVGVSSFGFSGTNAHVIIESCPAPGSTTGTVPDEWPYVVSARTPEALSEYLQRHAQELGTSEARDVDVAYTLACRRAHHRYRWAATAPSRAELRETLEAGAVQERTLAGDLVFLFSGQVSGTLAGYGRMLYETVPAFRRAFDQHCAALEGLPVPMSPLELLRCSEPLSPAATAVVQPALVCVQMALVATLRELGLGAHAVAGHSAGEIAAAVTAGWLAPADAVRFARDRGALMQQVAGSGTMASILAPVARVEELIQDTAGARGQVCIAALNTPELTVVSGDVDAITALIENCERCGVTARRLDVGHAFHSAEMDPILDELQARAPRSRPAAHGPTLVSTLTGGVVSGPIDAGYWCRQARERVDYAGALDRLVALGYRAFVEIGPSDTLCRLGRRRFGGAPFLWLPLGGKAGEWSGLCRLLSELYAAGAEVAWPALFEGVAAGSVPLATYPFQRRHLCLPFEGPSQQAMDATPSTRAIPGGNTMRSNEPQPRDGLSDTILVTLREIVAELLELAAAQVDVDASLLEMGADSLALMHAINAIHERFGLRLSVRQIFEELTTLRKIARHLADHADPARVQGSGGGGGGPVEATLAEPAEAREVSFKVAPAPASMASPLAAPPASAPQPVDRITTGEGHGAGVVSAPSDLAALAQAQLRTFAELCRDQLSLLGGLRPQPASVVAPEPSLHAPSAGPPTVVAAGPPAATGAPISGAPARTDTGAPSAAASPALRDLQERYNQRTRSSKAYAARHRPHLADLRSLMGFRPSVKELLYPLVKGRASGSRVWDIDGNEYIDLTLGFGVHLLGHDPPIVREALRRQLERGIELGPRSDLAGPVASKICQLTGFERVAFATSGTEAVTLAVRLARAATGRRTIAMFEGAYHGHADVTQARALPGQDGAAGPAIPGVTPGAVADTVVLRYGSEQALDWIQRHVNDLAAVLVEPVQSRFPGRQPVQFLRDLREITRAAGTPLVFDEMITGFRAHPRGAQGYFGIDADMATYGKILGGGMPVGVVAGSQRFLDRLDGGTWSYGDDSAPDPDVAFFGSTYAMHPLTMAASDALLTHLMEQGPGLQDALNDRTDRLARRLNELFTSTSFYVRVDHFASLFRFEIARNLDPFFYVLAENGVYVWEGRSCFLSTAHTDQDVDEIFEAVRRTVEVLSPPGGRGAPPPSGRPGQGSTSRQPATAAGRGSAASESAARRARKPWTAPATRGGHAIWAERRPLAPAAIPERPVDFGLSFFGYYDPAFDVDKYSLLVEATRRADKAGLRSVWLPERHFHAFGGISPNPSVLAAGLASVTEQISLRSGSVALPLHHPVRVAEEWSVVDNLSRGRVGLSFATGWHAKDFVLRPEAYADRRRIMFEHIEVIRRLWQGETVSLRGVEDRPVELDLVPRPCQAELPIWLSVVGNPQTFEEAGRIGAGILTSLLGQTIDQLAEKIELYRRALAEAGHDPARGHVALLLHTYLDHDRDIAVKTAREPFKAYLQGSVELLASLARSLGWTGGFDEASADDLDFLMDRAYERYVEGSALIGSPESCAPIAARFAAMGVDEIACLVDFGCKPEDVLRGVEHIASLSGRLREAGRAGESRGASVSTSGPAEVSPGRVEVARYELSLAQRQLWTLAQWSDEGALAYTLAMGIDVRAALDPGVVRAALDALCRKHEALRTVIGGDGTARVLETLPAGLAVTDLRGTGAPDRAVDDILDRESTTLVDLAHGPVLHAHLVRVDDERSAVTLRVHHALVDGWSLSLLAQELIALLRARDIPFMEPGPDFSRFAARERERAGERTCIDRARALADRLSQHAVTLAWPWSPPGARAPEASTGFQGQRLHHQVPLGARDIKQLARSLGVTPFLALLGSFGHALHRFLGLPKLVLGMPVANRPMSEDLELIGYCTHITPIFSELEPADTLSSYLQRLRGAYLDAMEAQDVPFAAVVELLRGQRDPFREPWVQVVFNVDRPIEASHEVTTLAAPRHYMGFDLECNLMEMAGSYRAQLDLRSACMDESTARRFLERWDDSVRALSGSPAQPARARDDRGPDRPLPPFTSLGDWLEESFRVHADAIALRSDEQSWTYGALRSFLDPAVEAIGRAQGSVIAVSCDDGPTAVLGILAALLARRAFLPMDARWPAKRREHILESARPALAITSRAGPDLPADLPCVVLDGGALHVHGPRSASGATWIEPAVAALLFTSGSTGLPKGVQVTHRGLIHYLDVALRTYVRGEDGRDAPLFGPPTFDLNFTPLFVPLLTGHAIDVFGGDDALFFLCRAMARRSYAFVKATPTHLQLLEQMPELGGARAPGALVIGGERLDMSLARRMRERFPATRIYNEYGPTEATVACATHLFRGDEDTPSVPIGRPIDRMRIQVMDALGQPAEIGVAGELVVSGPGVAAGYWNDASRTSARFVGDSYRTGDIGFWTHDGELVFVGRTDDQVKVNGVRVEPGEVERVLAEHPGVKQAMVAACEDENGRLALAAWWLPRDGVRTSDDELAAYLRAHLPASHIPALLRRCAQLPTTTSGKLDRRSLASLDGPGELAGAALGDQGTERRLLELARAVLGRADLTPSDDLGRAGMTSLQAVQLASSARAELGAVLLPSDIYRRGNVRAMAASMDAARERGLESGAVEELIVELRAPERPRADIWLIHPLGGHVLCYRKLIEHFAAARVMGVRAPGLHAGETPFRTVEEMASAYAASIVAQRLDGLPLILVGWSFGGVIAYELCRRLQIGGHSVEQLCLIDAHLYAGDAGLDAATEERHLVSAVTGRPVDELERRPLSLADAIQEAFRRQGAAGLIDQGDARRLEDLHRSHARALQQYRPAQLATPVRAMLIQPLAADERIRDEQARRWRQLVPHLQSGRLPGDHFSLIDEHAPALADTMHDLLDKQLPAVFARGGAPPSHAHDRAR